MSKFSVLFFQSYSSKLKAKSFLITTIIMLLALAAIFMWPTVSSWFSPGSQPMKITVVDQTGANAGALFQSGSTIKFNHFSGSVKQADQEVMQQKADGVLLLNLSGDDRLAAQIRSESTLKLNDQQTLEQYVQTANQLLIIQQMHLTTAQAQRILSAKVTLNQQLIDSRSSGKTSSEKTTASFISYGIALLVYLFAVSYLSIISSEIAAEKDSRIMEIIISSASPAIHLLSRVAAVLALAFTQTVVLIGAALILAYYSNSGKYWDMMTHIFSAISPYYLVLSLLFFILACILYTLVGAVLGSLVSKVQDVGQSVMPVTFILMIGFFVAISGMNNPDTLLVQIFSYIPFTSSMLMPMRIGATDMGLWQAFLSLLILAFSIICLFLFSLRFYRGSVLTYTSGSIVKKIKQAFSLSK
ncbi:MULTISPECIES: ABC transporter permease [unclassified Sporolactobacillus]|uniref:ABC transporter permease n=1 Tax=unclassified Sporolactobacillus TaxID=2628533 RepID=UPI002367DDFA|nr:ABC transporter permease [Sporolactobacillus sp. CQH2019]MDD9148688.1 ABC transporter permease [Sporolactobacillus sp. CQH2019]